MKRLIYERLWGLPVNVIQRSEVAELFTLGGGGIIFVIFASYFGRLPTLFICQLVSTAAGTWSALAKSFASFVASRAVNGLFGVTAAAVSLYLSQEFQSF